MHGTGGTGHCRVAAQLSADGQCVVYECPGGIAFYLHTGIQVQFVIGDVVPVCYLHGGSVFEDKTLAAHLVLFPAFCRSLQAEPVLDPLAVYSRMVDGQYG